MTGAGGNYIGAANQSQALTNFVNSVVDPAGVFLGVGKGETCNNYAITIIPAMSASLAANAPGKVALSYEGGTDWPTQSGYLAPANGYRLTYADAIMSIAAINSSQWATAQTNFFNTVAGFSNVFMPSIYTWIGSNIEISFSDPAPIPQQRWCYTSPDSYANISGTPTEGAGLTVNSPVWIAMSARNVALPN